MPKSTTSNGYEIISAAQIRAARALIDASTMTVAVEASMSESGLRVIESGRANPLRTTITRLKRALEDLGVVFIQEGAAPPNGDEDFTGAGVRLRGK